MTDIAQGAAHVKQRAGVRARHDLAVLEVRGDDHRSWLNGQLTNDVREPATDASVYALVVTVKGKILADAWVLDASDCIRLAVPRDAVSALLERFEQQIIMEDVTVAPSELTVISVQGPLAREVVQTAGVARDACFGCDELGFGGVFVLATEDARTDVMAKLVHAAQAQGGDAIDEAAFELARLRAGRGRFGLDFGARDYPQEAGLRDAAVSFEKGCYVGQEVVHMLEHRGKVPRRLARLQGQGELPAPGASLRNASGTEVGTITSAVCDPDPI